MGLHSRSLPSIVVVATLLAAGCSTREVAPTSFSSIAAHGDIWLAPDSEIIPGRVPPNSTFAGLLRAAGLDDADVEGLVAAADNVFDLRRVRTAQPWRLERATDGHVRWLEYEIDPVEFLRIVPAPVEDHEFVAEIVRYDTRSQRTVVEGTIDETTGSLFASMASAGEQPELPIALADIFGGEIDFNSDLQPGDHFKLVVEKTYRDHRFVKYGPVLSAAFTNAGRTLVGIRYAADGAKASYYDSQGRSLRRFFLRSPLKFDPIITSKFTRARMHPVLHVMRAHLGVDYRAPVGAPVIAVASGTVTGAGWRGGGGRTVSVRHASGYESYYLHLSSIGVRRGQHVSQGQLLGRVGQSGLATGPHLDYRLRRKGVWVNPVAEHRKMPPGDPVPASEQDAFGVIRDAALDELDLPTADVVSASTTSDPGPQTND
jgi:murein DD-endopeptidase MepM/ murein hydrolase activator NlpD